MRKGAAVQDFRKLKTWEKSHRLAMLVYQATRLFPKEEKFGLVSQMRQSAASIPTNIAEGCGRGGGAEMARFLQIAIGSAHELDYQLLLSKDLGYLSPEDYQDFFSTITDLKRMLAGLLTKVRPISSKVGNR